MDSHEEWSILDMIEIQAVKTTGKVECSDKASFVGEERTFYEVDSLRVL